MSILGEKCVRCGNKRTRQEFEGLPTCDGCITHIYAEREQKHHCPVDGKQMNKRVINNVVIDQCPQCAGIWLDKGELELLRKGNEESGMEFFGGMFLGSVLDFTE